MCMVVELLQRLQGSLGAFEVTQEAQQMGPRHIRCSYRSSTEVGHHRSQIAVPPKLSETPAISCRSVCVLNRGQDAFSYARCMPASTGAAQGALGPRQQGSCLEIVQVEVGGESLITGDGVGALIHALFHAACSDLTSHRCSRITMYHSHTISSDHSPIPLLI